MWSASKVRTVSRSSVAWWPDSGATTSTTGSSLRSAMVPGSSEKRLKRTRSQNGFCSTLYSTIGTSWPWAVTERMPNSGFS